VDNDFACSPLAVSMYVTLSRACEDCFSHVPRIVLQVSMSWACAPPCSHVLAEYISWP
jgi:hypothetical protein